jgi:hypothetical protein
LLPAFKVFEAGDFHYLVCLVFLVCLVWLLGRILYVEKQFGKNELSFYRAIIFTSMFNIVNCYMFGFGVYPINDAIITESHPTQATQIVRQGWMLEDGESLYLHSQQASQFFWQFFSGWVCQVF